MARFKTKISHDEFEVAPDGSEIRPLLGLRGGSFTHCTLPVGGVSLAVRHRTVEEIWYFVGGEGQVWRRQGDREETVDVSPGTCLTIPLGTSFQFRNTSGEPLRFVVATMPPWPGEGEVEWVEGRWRPL